VDDKEAETEATPATAEGPDTGAAPETQEQPPMVTMTITLSRSMEVGVSCPGALLANLPLFNMMLEGAVMVRENWEERQMAKAQGGGLLLPGAPAPGFRGFNGGRFQPRGRR